MKFAVVAILMLVGISLNNTQANDQLAYSDAVEAFNNAKAPDMKIMSNKLTPVGFAIKGDQIDKKARKKIMKQDLQLKIETNVLGKTYIYDPAVTYDINNEGEKYLPLTLNENGLKGEVLRKGYGFRMRIAQECRQLEISSIICKFEMYYTDVINLELITVYRPVVK